MRTSFIAVILLAACQALSMSSSSLMISTSPLIGSVLAPDKSLATLPFSLQLIATALATIPASLVMARYGRRAGFILFALIGSFGNAIATLAIFNDSFLLFCFGVIMAGVFAASTGFYRFAASEVAEESFRSKATSLVLAGGVLAAFIGPQIAKFSRDLFPVQFAGAYVALIFLPLGTVVLQLFLRLPKAPERASHQGGDSTLSILLRPQVLVAVFSGIVGFAVMVFIMTATPLAMAGCGFGFNQSASVIQWHIFSMFVPSFFTGNLVQRFGVTRVMLVGAFLMLACVAVATRDITFLDFSVALIALGIGWNFLYIGSTIMLTKALAPQERAKIQGINEFLVFGFAAAGSLASGATQHAFGWNAVNLAMLPFVVLAALAILVLHIKQRRPVPALAT
jgi:MFS family permease